MATVSIIIPAYNYGHYLAETIDSALSQTYPDIEVIVVDDGSTDDTAEVCKRYGDQIRYAHKDNAGVSAARNTGVQLSSGEYIVFLDADDVLLPGMVQTCLDHFSECNEQVAIVAGRREVIDSAGDRVTTRSSGLVQSNTVGVRDLVFSNRFFAPSSVLVRRSVIDRCGSFDEDLECSEDRDMWIRIAALYEIRIIDDTVLKYRVHPDSLSHRAEKMYRGMGKVLKKARFSEDGASYGPLFWAAAFAYRDFQAAWIFYGEGCVAKALSLTVRSLLRYPWVMNASILGQPTLFRVRGLKTFLLDLVFGGSS